jgi:hypothetical protein
MGDIAERIANVRREAEALKEKIKVKRDALADTTRNFSFLTHSKASCCRHRTITARDDEG